MTSHVKTKKKYLAFPQVMILKVCTVQGKGYTFSIFQWNTFCLMLKNTNFSVADKTIVTTLHLFFFKMFLEAILTRLKNLRNFNRRKVEKL